MYPERVRKKEVGSTHQVIEMSGLEAELIKTQLEGRVLLKPCLRRRKGGVEGMMILQTVHEKNRSTKNCG